MKKLKAAVIEAAIWGGAAAAGLIASNLTPDGANLFTVGEEAAVAALIAVAKFVHAYLDSLKRVPEAA